MANKIIALGHHCIKYTGSRYICTYHTYILYVEIAKESALKSIYSPGGYLTFELAT